MSGVRFLKVEKEIVILDKAVESTGIVRGGRPGHLKAITPPPQGVRGAKGPPGGSEVSFFKTIQSIRK